MSYYEKLRQLLIYNGIAFLILFVFIAVASSYILKIFSYGFNLYVFGVGDALTTLLYISFLTSLVIYFPIFIFTMFKFFEDGLYEHEKRAIKKYSVIMFVLALIGAFIGLEISKFTIAFGKWIANLLGVTLMQSAKEIFMINFTVVMGTALCMEVFPILRMLIKFKIINKETLTKNRLLIYIIIYVAVAILTPGDYVIGDISLFALLVILFELTVRL